MAKPIIGILGNILVTTSSTSGSVVRRSFTNDTCVRSVANNGGVPVILPFVSDLSLMNPLLEACDGLLFPGGDDVDPAYYGETPHEKLGEVDHALDECWFHAARHAMERQVPMLGICRGAQLLNVACGGSLYQDIGERGEGHLTHVQAEKRHVVTQTVRVVSGTRLARLLGQEAVPVNSLHHQSVKALGKDLIVSAQAEDGIVEAIESADGLIVATQWHPEDLIESVPVMNTLFQDLTSRAAERCGD